MGFRNEERKRVSLVQIDLDFQSNGLSMDFHETRFNENSMIFMVPAARWL